MTQSLLIKPKKTTDDGLIPLINIVFLLIIFFMVAGQVSSVGNGAIQFPESFSRIEVNTKYINLRMDSKKKLILNENLVDLSELANRIAQHGNSKELNINLSLDKKLQMQDVQPLLSQLRELQVATLNVVTMEKLGK
jgi:biopolymer transport protein ExbD